jgi:molybdopterin converting factor subunit 1
MRVTVRLFASLRDRAGEPQWDAEVPDGATVAEVWDAVVARHPDLAPYGRSTSCAVNADFARRQARVHDGDEVAFLPPVSGG